MFCCFTLAVRSRFFSVFLTKKSQKTTQKNAKKCKILHGFPPIFRKGFRGQNFFFKGKNGEKGRFLPFFGTKKNPEKRGFSLKRWSKTAFLTKNVKKEGKIGTFDFFGRAGKDDFRGSRNQAKT